eukprot:TRINITY_DN3754_c0_g1_i2.p1 TRINITY_DN3754_c0_g1~~TRINITY_DN3754_c0_g1_i2.p1  ORF type:complete len:320 (-),score=76.28 TRINITY_DN3754_c0_g1_i2:250-1209(-)
MQRQSSIGNTQVSSAFKGSDKTADKSPNLQPEEAESPLITPVAQIPAPSPPIHLPPHQNESAGTSQPITLYGEAQRKPALPNGNSDFEQMQMIARLQAQHLQAPPQQQHGDYYPTPGGYVQGHNPTMGAQYYSGENDGWQQDTPAPTEEAALEADESEDAKGRSKAQMKNQKKHQRQRERKAKELRNQCLQLVVKWKLNSLAEPLFSMGFPQDQCVDAVCACSDGKSAVDLERCVAWILSEQAKGSAFAFGGADETKKTQQPDIDISDEVKKMVELESSIGISGAEVEKAVLAHNGDVNSAALQLGGNNGNSGYAAMVH